MQFTLSNIASLVSEEYAKDLKELGFSVEKAGPPSSRLYRVTGEPTTEIKTLEELIALMKALEIPSILLTEECITLVDGDLG